MTDGDHIKTLARLMQNVAQQDFPASALYVVGTPIGNAGDISLRALHVLTRVDAIACEDTRVTGILLAQYGISCELIATHQHNEHRMAKQIITRLLRGERIALVTDAGTPAISDPGVHLVDAVHSAGLRVIPIPGPSAAITALSVAGLPADHFYFVGFLPSKNAARNTALQSLATLPATLVIYEAPHRMPQTLDSLQQVLGGDRQIVIAREVTKLFEEIHRCRLSETSAWLASDSNHTRGEFVLLVEGAASGSESDEVEAERILAILLSEYPVSQAAALAARITGAKKNRLYERALAMQNADQDT